jgi:hypothetical protein
VTKRSLAAIMMPDAYPAFCLDTRISNGLKMIKEV